MARLKQILFGTFILLAAGWVLFRWYGFFTGPSVKQPLEFNHQVHTEMLKCEECHTGVMNSAYAGLPDIKICRGCHSGEPLSKSPEEKKLLNLIERKQNIAWKRLFRNPVHVYFSHARHVAVGKVGCEQCHGAMGKRVKPPGKALVKLDMGDCIACHEKNNVDTSCVICHR